MTLTSEQIEKAAKALKVMRLAGSPGMDLVAIKLNMGLTYDEQEYAKLWARAFKLAEEYPNVSAIEIASMLARK